MTSTHPETFRCIPLGCTLSRESCGARHKAARRSGPRPSAVPRMSLIGAKGTCGTCEVGAAHARGERPDVTIASVVARATEAKAAKTEVVEMPKIVKHAHNGKTLTLKEWAQEPEAKGLSLATLRDRVNSRRLTIAQALEEAPATSAAKPVRTAKRAKVAASSKAAAVTKAKVATLDEHIAKRRAFITERRADAHVTEIGSAEHAASVLKRLGYVVEDAGLVPAGRLILVRTPHAPQVSL